MTINGAVAAKGVDGLAGADSGLLTGLKLDETLKTKYKVKIAGDTATNVEDNKCPKLDTEKNEKLLEIGDGGAFSHEITFPAADAPADEKNCKYTISVVPQGDEEAGWENTRDVYAFTVKQQKTSDKITVKGTGSGDALELKKGTATSQDDDGDAIKFAPEFHAAVFDLNKDKSGGDPSWDKDGADKAAKVVALTKDGQDFKKLSEKVDDPEGIPTGKAFAGWYTAAENGDKLASASKNADVSGKTKLFAHYADLVKVNFLKEDSTKAEGDAVAKTIEVAKGGDLKSKKADIPTDATSLCVDNAGGKTVEKRLTGWKKLENGSATGSEVTTESLTDTSAPTFATETSYVAQCQKRPVVTFKNSDNTIDGKVELVVDANGKLAESDIPGDNSFCTNTGQVFKGWRKDNTGSGLKSKAELKAETFNDSASYTASCAAPSVTLKAGTGGNFSSSTEKPVDIVDDSVTVPHGSDAAQKSDRVLMGWRLTKKGESSQAELNKVYKVGNDNKLEGYTPADGDELTAVWGVKVKFNSNADTTSGGSAVIKFKDGKPNTAGDAEYVLVEEGKTIPTGVVPGDKLACVKNGTTEHAVKQWNTSSGSSAAAYNFSTNVPDNTDELVLTAECAEPITVKFNPNKGDFVKDTQGVDKGVVSITVGKGGTINPLDGAKALIREGYKFAKWCDGTGSDNATSPTKADGTVDNGTCDTASSFATLDAGKTVFAVWTAEADKKIEYYDSKGKVTGATAVATDPAVKYNSVPTKKDGKDEYCKDSGKPVFDYWTLNSNNETTPAQYKFEERVTADVELKAVCKAEAAAPVPAPNPSNPSVTPGGSGSGSGSTGGSTGGSYFGGGSFGGGSSTPSTPAKDKKDDGKKKPGDKKQQPVVNKFDKQFTKKLDLPKNAVVRSAGQDRVATSLAALSLAKNHDTVVLATGSNFPDALTGGALAGALKAGVVLTTSSTLEQSVVNALKAQGTKTVYIVGGQSVVPAAKEAALQAAGFQVVRLAGADRYETAALVKAETLKRLGGKAMVSCNATGANFPDALACASAASLSGGVVDLVRPGQSVAVDKVAGKTICAGGSACAAAGASVTKVVGSDRYETAYLLASTTPAKGKVLVANGMSYADSLVAGALAGSTGANLVLSNAKRVNVPAGTTSAHLFGGSAVLPDNLPMYTK